MIPLIMSYKLDYEISPTQLLTNTKTFIIFITLSTKDSRLISKSFLKCFCLCPCIKLLTCNWIINNVKSICIAIRSLYIFTTVINFRCMSIFMIPRSGPLQPLYPMLSEPLLPMRFAHPSPHAPTADSSSKYNCSAYGATLHALSQHPH